MISFDEDRVDAGVMALTELKDRVDKWNQSMELQSRLIVKAHFDRVVAGLMGTKENKNFDLIGNGVNKAALLRSNGFALTVEAFRSLNPETRTYFKKHTPPVSYIAVTEPHRN